MKQDKLLFMLQSVEMGLKVDVFSREIIKPSFSTPDHLRSLKLSLIDQITPPLYEPIVFFYTAKDDDHYGKLNIKIDRLKSALSETLTRFYPMAGRTKDNILVDCNDEGVDFSEAIVQGDMADSMKLDLLHQLLPDTHNGISSDGEVLFGVQVNMFNCGGMAIGTCFSHKIADASSVITFINAWALTACGSATDVMVSPTFDSASLFPPCEGVSSLDPAASQGEGEKVVTRVFTFDASKVAALRAKLVSETLPDMYPTRVEAVSTLIWKAALGKYSSISDLKPKLSLANHAMNLRGRMDPPLDERSFGNLLTSAAAVATSTSGLDELLSQLRVAKGRIDAAFVMDLQGEGGIVKIQELLEKGFEMFGKGDEVEVYLFSSWCRFPYYEADFGWGKPNWVSLCSQPYKNTVVLLDTRDGDGIEAWVNLVKDDMVMFERNPELLEFVSFIN